MNFSKRLIAAPQISGSSIDDLKRNLHYSSSSQVQPLSSQLQQHQTVIKQQVPANPLLIKPQQELCQKHNEQKVAFDRDSNQLLCNKCIFENQKIKSESSNAHSQTVFTPLITKDIKKRYDQAYKVFTERATNIEDIEPEKVKKLLIQQVRNYFQELRNQLKNQQSVVNQKIQSSETLKKLEDIMEKNSNFFSSDAGKVFFSEQKKFDGKLQRSRYASIITHKDFFNDILSKVDESVVEMNEVCQNIKDLGSRVLNLSSDFTEFIASNFDQLMDESFLIDLPLGPEDAPDVEIITCQQEQMEVQQEVQLNHGDSNLEVLQDQHLQAQQEFDQKDELIIQQ
eukprot:403369982